MRRIEITSLPILPANLPISLAEAKQHARIQTTTDDALVLIYIEAAVHIAEQETQKRFVQRMFRVWLDCADKEINTFTQPQASSVVTSGTRKPLELEVFDSGLVLDAFTQFDALNVETPVPATEFLLLGNRLTFDGTFSALVTREFDSLKIEYTVNAANLTESVRNALLIITTHMYENRDLVLKKGTVVEYPVSAKALLHNDKVYAA